MPEEIQKAKQGTDPETPTNNQETQTGTPQDGSPRITPPAKGSTEPETPTQERTQNSQRLHERYDILRALGQGGMGQVFGAYDIKQQKSWAIKRALGGQTAALQQEKIALDLLQTPAELREDEESLLCTKWLHGKNLSQFTKTTGALLYLLKSAQELSKAHQRGLIHRDIKPSHLWVMPDGEVQILDWGISALEGQRQTISRGTLGFAAPEQRRGAPARASADVFSLGVILSLLSPRESSLQKVLQKATKADPDERYQNARDFAKALQLAI